MELISNDAWRIDTKGPRSASVIINMRKGFELFAQKNAQRVRSSEHIEDSFIGELTATFSGE
jgi:hypothetical protein